MKVESYKIITGLYLHVMPVPGIVYQQRKTARQFMIYISQKRTKPGNNDSGLLAHALFTVWDDGTTNLGEVQVMSKGIAKASAVNVLESALKRFGYIQ